MPHPRAGSVVRTTLIVGACLGLVTSPSPAQAARDVARLRNEGDSAIVRHDWKRLAALYEPAIKTDSANGMAWFRLAAARHELRDFRGAVEAFRHSANLKFQPAQSELRLARAFARLGERDSALAHIRLATDNGAAVEVVTTEPDFDPIRKDKAFGALVSRLEASRFPCRSQMETHQFDFWLGEWDVTPWAGPAVTIGRVSKNIVTAELEHCIIHEHWTSNVGGKGESINFWDPNRRAWRQVWMDAHQWSLDYEGQYENGAMRFSGWTLGADGKRRLEKLTFFNIASDTVRQLFEQSADSGKSWQVTFDGRYVRVRPRLAPARP